MEIKNEQDEIKELKEQLNKSNKKMILWEATTNNILINNNFSTIHNNNITNDRASSRWPRKKENDEKRIPSNNSYLLGNRDNSLKKN